jgi:hypothetical protein
MNFAGLPHNPPTAVFNFVFAEREEEEEEEEQVIVFSTDKLIISH